MSEEKRSNSETNSAANGDCRPVPCSPSDVGEWVRSVNNPRLQGLVIEEEASRVRVDFGWGLRWVPKEVVEVADIGDHDTNRDNPWLDKFISSLANRGGVSRHDER